MIEAWQILLVSVVTILTIILTIIGIQVIYILKEARATLTMFNRVVKDAGKVTNAVSTTVGSMSGFSSGMKTAVNLISLIKNHVDKVDKK